MITYTSEQQGLLNDPHQEVKLLVEIVAPTTTLRYCTGAEPFVISTYLYSPRAIKPSDLEYTEPNGSVMKIDIDNSDQAISDVGEADPDINGSPITLKLYIRRKAAGNSWVLLSTWTMYISGIDWDYEWASISLTGYSKTKPHAILTVGSRTCTNRGGDGRCQYGSDIVCGGTYDECEDFSNVEHFNGWRYAPDPDTTIEFNYFSMTVSGDISPSQQQQVYRYSVPTNMPGSIGWTFAQAPVTRVAMQSVNAAMAAIRGETQTG